jgi:hypothetical protein
MKEPTLAAKMRHVSVIMNIHRIALKGFSFFTSIEPLSFRSRTTLAVKLLNGEIRAQFTLGLTLLRNLRIALRAGTERSLCSAVEQDFGFSTALSAGD